MTQPLIRANQINTVTIGGTAGSATDVLTSRTYVDDADFLTYGPKAGQTSSDSIVPVYSDFKFALGSWGQAPMIFVDNQSRQVIYFTARSPIIGVANLYRAYRYNENQSFIFDNAPIAPSFVSGGEVVQFVSNLGTNFITLITSTGRVLLVRTNGSSQYQDWTLLQDVTSIGGTTNWALINTGLNERILRFTSATGTNATLYVYDTSMNLLRQQVLIDYTNDVDITDHTGAGRTVSRIQGPGYTVGGLMCPFSWNRNTEAFNSVWHYFAPYSDASGAHEDGFGISIAWSIPKTWFDTGAGTPTNYITIKNGTYRYRQLSDDTWDTDTGGMSRYYGTSGFVDGFIVDEYSGQTYFSRRGTFESTTAGTFYKYTAGTILKTMGANTAGLQTLSFEVTIPDGSAWSKGLGAARIYDSTAVFNGGSVRYGNNSIAATFSTTSFTSGPTTNDTLKLDAPTAYIAPQNQPGIPTIVKNNWVNELHGSTMVGGSPVSYWAMPGSPIYTTTASGTALTYTATSVNVPVIPTTVSGINIASYSQPVWNGSTSTPQVWFVVHAVDQKQYIATWSGSTWSLVGGEQAATAVADGNTARGDTANLNYYTGGSILTASGKMLYHMTIPFIGGSNQYVNIFDTTNNTSTTYLANKFLPTGVNGTGQYGTYGASNISARTFGISSTFGYFMSMAEVSSASAVVVSSRNVETGTSITEVQWIDGSVSRPQKFYTVEAAVGLVAYLVEYPIFLGGYLTKTPTTSVSLLPNATNYIYVTKDTGSRTGVFVTVSTQLLPASFSRMLLAKIVTDAQAATSSTLYSYDGSGLPSYTSNDNKILSNDGTKLLWVEKSGTVRNTTTSTVISASDNNGVIIVSANNLTVTVPSDPSVPVGAKVTIYVGSVTGNQLTFDPGMVLRWVGTGSGVTGNRSLAQYAVVELRKVSATDWLVHGQGIS